MCTFIYIYVNYNPLTSLSGLTPLLEAASAGHAKCVNMLQNADPEAADDVDPSGNTALHLASQVICLQASINLPLSQHVICR